MLRKIRKSHMMDIIVIQNYLKKYLINQKKKKRFIYQQEKLVLEGFLLFIWDIMSKKKYLFVQKFAEIKESNILQELNQNQVKDVLKFYDKFIYEYDDIFGLRHKHFILVTQLLGHNLLKLVERYAPTISPVQAIPLQAVKHIIKQLLHQIQQLHQFGIIHSDLKLENIALTKYLPDIKKDSKYEIYNLLFGFESQNLYTCQLFTPANIIEQQNIKLLDTYLQYDISDFKDYLQQVSLNSTNTIPYDYVFRENNYDQLIQQFQEQYFKDTQELLQLLDKNIFNMKDYINNCSQVFNKIKFQQQQDMIIKLDQSYQQLDQIDQDKICKDFQVDDEGNINIENYKVVVDTTKNIYNSKQVYCKSRYKLENNENKTYYITKSAFTDKNLFIQFVTSRIQQNQQQNYVVNPIDYRYFALSKQKVAYYPLMVRWFDRNLLLPYSDEIFDIKIIDYGNYIRKDNLRNQCIGTRTYRAPESILGCQLTEKSDIFAIGCITYELLVGQVLFSIKKSQDEFERDYHHLQQMQKYLSNKQDWQKIMQEGDQEIIDKIQQYGQIKSKEQKQLSCMLQDDYNFSQQESLKVEQFLLKLLCIDPEKRPSAEEALQLEWLNIQAQSDNCFSNGGRRQTI